MALSIAKPKHISLTNPTLIHLFSSSPYPDTPSQPPPEDPHNNQQTSPPSHFAELRATLKQPPQNEPYTSSFGDIKQRLSGFRSRSGQQQQPPPSFQELYKRHDPSPVSSQPISSNVNFSAIRESMKQIKLNKSVDVPKKSVDVSGFTQGQFKPTVFRGTSEIPLPMSGKESGKDNSSSIEFVKMYSMDELGDRLRSLRPEMKETGWFSFEELAERLGRLRKLEEKEIQNSNIGIPMQHLRESLSNIKQNDSNEKKKAMRREIQILANFSEPDYKAYPPQEHLVEQYFHPDNMSSAEKMKLELSKVREEFKMSESDCGSARVQVAQLTTKIKHLSSVLHKKDKHSRKGLQEMVQRRKKLLKYLRRTDWDSYCLVLSKLGLRDNADMKH
ncbi:30S ribosomal protein S15 [Euphorbia peplus]|nr:30S ribosomal protein S15 [Euphorbia peplus]